MVNHKPRQYFPALHARSVPLISLASIGLAIVFAGEFYAAILVVNALLLLLLITDVTDYSSWFIAYELSVLTGVSALTLEGRSVRRLYAFLVMFGCTAIASLAFYLVLNFSRENLTTSWLVLAVATVAVIVKVPVFPFSIWLPEAHVEASWPGSIVLAGFALKFSTFACLLFVAQSLFRLDLVVALLFFSVCFGVVAMCSVVDAKKLVANFSVVHMSVAVVLLTSPISSELFVNLSWHHHSIVTSMLFLLIGFSYATSSSRLFRLLVANRDALPVFLLIMLSMITLSLDLPWTPNVLVELQLVKQTSSLPTVVVALVVVFWAVISAYLVFSVSKQQATSSSIDTPASDLVLVAMSAATLVPLGFVAEMWRRGNFRQASGHSADLSRQRCLRTLVE